MVRATSLQAYEDINTDGTTVSQRLKILHYLRRFPDGLIREEISNDLSISINAICGRIKELLNFGTIYESGKRINKKTGKENLILKAKVII